MSQFFDQASLVMVPSGYKNGKVYSQKPLSADGELTFTRASNASRVNADGLIEKVRTNLLTYSNDFSNAAWVVTGAPTLTPNYAANPITGANDAWRFQSASASDRIYQVFSGSFHTASLYAKGTGILRLRDSSGTYSTELVLTSSWQRISIVIPAAFGNVQITSNGGCDAAIYAAQLEVGDIATDYIETTTAAVSVGPVSGLPRLDYSGGATCGKLLLEPQRTNFVTHSNYDATYWPQTNASVSVNSAISPDGYQNAHTATRTSASNVRVGTASFSAVVGQSYTNSIYLRKVSGSGSVNLFDINGSPTLVNLTSEWARYSVTATATASTQRLYVDMNSDGDVIEFWQGQIEQGSYPTSLITTLGSAVTRLADSASKTGISSLIGQTEGTLFVDINYTNTENTSDATPFRLLGSGSAQMYVEINTNDTFEAVVVNSAGTLVFNFTSAPQSAGRKKIAIAYKGSDFAYYINGVQIAVQTSGAFASASLDTFNLGMYSSTVQQLADSVNQALLFKTRLTNAQLAELTAL